MRVFVPFDGREPKSRLEPVLEADERRRLAYAMLADVCAVVKETGREPTVLATDDLTPPGDEAFDVLEDVSLERDDRSLSVAVNDVLADGRQPPSPEHPVAIVMADLALVRPDTLERCLSTAGDVVIAPGRGGGTNALVVRHGAFRTDYHGTSFLDHRAIAADRGLSLECVDSFRLATDIDEPDDLVEAWLHGGPRTRTMLEEAGFQLQTTRGRVTLERR